MPIYTHMHIHAHTHTLTHKHTHTHVYMHTHMPCICTCTNMHRHKHIHTLTHKHIFMCTHRHSQSPPHVMVRLRIFYLLHGEEADAFTRICILNLSTFSVYCYAMWHCHTKLARSSRKPPLPASRRILGVNLSISEHIVLLNSEGLQGGVWNSCWLNSIFSLW